MTITKIEDLKDIQIVCKNLKQVKDCFKYLRKLGYYDYYKKKDKQYFDNDLFVNFYKDFWFYAGSHNDTTKKLEFYDKNFVKTLQKFIRQKEEKEKIEDFEVAEDGRITKINNKKSKKEIFVNDWEYKEDSIDIEDMTPVYFDYVLKYGLAYATSEARKQAMFKLEIETKLKNIAKRLNNGRKIDWKGVKQVKFYIVYYFEINSLVVRKCNYSKDIGQIYCLDKNFLEVAKKEIGEDKLIKYFTEE